MASSVTASASLFCHVTRCLVSSVGLVLGEPTYKGGSAPSLGKRKKRPVIALKLRCVALTLIRFMQLIVESAWTQTRGSEWTLKAHSSHFWSSASLMQHQRTRLFERELPKGGGRR